MNVAKYLGSTDGIITVGTGLIILLLGDDFRQHYPRFFTLMIASWIFTTIGTYIMATIEERQATNR